MSRLALSVSGIYFSLKPPGITLSAKGKNTLCRLDTEEVLPPSQRAATNAPPEYFPLESDQRKQNNNISPAGYRSGSFFIFV